MTQPNEITVTINQDELMALMQLIDAACKHLGANATAAAYHWQTKLFNAQQKSNDNGDETELPKVGE